MAQPGGRSPEEHALLEKARRLLLGGDYRATLTADRALHAAFTRELLARGGVKAAQKVYVSLAHGEAEIERTIEAFTAALAAAAGQRAHARRTPS